MDIKPEDWFPTKLEVAIAGVLTFIVIMVTFYLESQR